MDGWTCNRCLAGNDPTASECARCALVRGADPTFLQRPPVPQGEPPLPPDDRSIPPPAFNRLAITSLAVAVIGISATGGFILSLLLEPASAIVVAAFAGVVLAAVLGPLALLQIRRHGHRGASFAVATLVLSGMWIALISAGIAISPAGGPELTDAMVSVPTTEAPEPEPVETTTTIPSPLLGEPERSPTGEVVGPGSILVDDLALGNCLRNRLGDIKLFFRVDVVPCKDMHRGEVYDVIVLPPGDWPGDDSLFMEADERCNVALYDLAPADYGDPDVEIFYFHPTEVSWVSGDRTIQCLAEFAPPGRTGRISSDSGPREPTVTTAPEDVET